MKYINLTHHSVEVNGVTIPPSGEVAEYDEVIKFQGTINGLEKYQVVGGTIVGLPSPKKNVTHIVTCKVKENSPQRADLVSLSSVWGQNNRVGL
jgi:hypothetical protein